MDRPIPAGEPIAMASASPPLPLPSTSSTASTAAATKASPFIQTGSSSHPLSNRSQVHIDASALPPGLSKTAAKKLAKKQYYEDTKLVRRRAEKDKKKQKKRDLWQQQKQQQETAGAEAAEVAEAAEAAAADGEQGDVVYTGKRKRDQAPTKSKPKRVPFGARLLVDLGFDDLMSEREAASMGQQLMYLYSSNKTSHRPFKEVIFAGRGHVPGSSYLSAAAAAATTSEKGEERDEAMVERQPGKQEEQPSIYDSPTGHFMEQKMRGTWRSWKGITILERGGLEAIVSEPCSQNVEDPSSGCASSSAEASTTSTIRLAKEDVTYLTADTDDVLTGLEEGKTYVIGGIVDKNRHKSLCLNKASQLGIRRAKLPISDENLNDFERRLRAQGETSHAAGGRDQGGAGTKKQGGYQGRRVLTVNQVADILLGWTESRDWVEAIGRGIPRRRFDQGVSASSPGGVEATGNNEETVKEGAGGVEGKSSK